MTSRTWATGPTGNTPITADWLNGIESDLDARVKTTDKGVAGGVASLDGNGKLQPSQIPATASIQPWTPSTAYAAGQQVISPSGDIMAAYNAHTSGASYTSDNWYGDYGWLMACFTGDGAYLEKLSVFYSPDGKIASGGNANPVYTDPATGNSLRDPSVKYWNGAWYAAYTSNNGINKNFKIASGASLTNLTDFATIDCSALSDISRIWAPEIVFDPATPTRPYIFFTKMNAAGTNGSMYWIQATNDALTTWTTPVRMVWTAEPAHYIDGAFIQVSGIWYMFYSIGSDIYRANAASLTATWTADKNTSNWAGWGTGIEGPEIVQYAPSQYRIYMDRFQSGLGYGYSESPDLNTWTAVAAVTPAPNALPPGGLIRHGSFVKLPGKALQNLVLAATQGGDIQKPHAEFAGSFTAGFAAVTAIGAPALVAANTNNDKFVTQTGGAGFFTFLAAGDYVIEADFVVTISGNPAISRTFAELQSSTGTTLVRSAGAAEDKWSLSVPNFKATAGQQIKITAFQQNASSAAGTIATTVRITRNSR